MVPHYGKREPGGLTASNPGDTLYFNYGSYNDSGDSEIQSGFAVTDIEVFKNGNATTRATDSGYSLISDTGQIGDRIGLNRFSLQIFNTSDDTGHYEVGAWYQVAVDSVTIDGKTVRLWVGSFEIGRAQIHDTGIYDRISNLDTGLRDHVNNTDTGLRAFIDDIDTGLRDTLADYDTGIRDYITDLDTGLGAQIARLAEDTGGVSIDKVRGDTGAAHRFFRFLEKSLDTGGDLTVLDTGIYDRIANLDTGIRDHIDNTDTGLRARIDDLDTGVTNYLGRLDTGGADLTTIRGDTGAADRLLKFAGSQLKIDGTLDTGTGQTSNTLNVLATADTGLVNNAATARAQTDKLTFDTGNELQVDIKKVAGVTITGTGDTGTNDTWRPA